MKKMFAKLGMPSLLSLAFLLGGLFFGANSAQAQTLVGSAASSPIKTTAPWKSVAAAKDALNSEITYIDQQLTANTPSNGPQLKMKKTIYAAIVADLEIGVEVPVAAYNNFYRYSPTGPQNQSVDANPAIPGITNSDWSAIYSNMLGVLAQ